MLLVFIIIVIIIIINNNNAVRWKEKYLNLIKEMSRNYRCVKFVNLSLYELPWRFLQWMLHVLRHDEWHWHWQKAATLYNEENDNYSH